MAAEITAPESEHGEQTVEAKKPSIWIRGIYMLLFLIITRLTELVVAVVMLIQFVLKAATGNINKNLMTFGSQLSKYLFAIVQFQTFNTEEKPFPFDQWPQGDELSE